MIFSVEIEIAYGKDAVVAFETGTLAFECESKEVPVWNWLGKSPTDMKSMAVGDKKRNRFTESR